MTNVAAEPTWKKQSGNIHDTATPYGPNEPVSDVLGTLLSTFILFLYSPHIYFSGCVDLILGRQRHLDVQIMVQITEYALSTSVNDTTELLGYPLLDETDSLKRCVAGS